MNRKLAVGFIVLVLIAVGVCSAQDMLPRPRLISVRGTAEINVDPNEVVMRLGVETHDKEIALAKSQHDARMKKVIGLARSEGIEAKDIQTSWLSLSPDYSEEKIPRLLGYEVSQTITITLRDLSKYESLITKFLAAGINRVHSVDFKVAETRKYKDEVRTKALRAAKEKATAMAAELGQTIGKPWEIAEDSEGYQPLANATFGYYANVSASEEATVAPGQVSIRATVRVSFQLE
ncbi:MAG TPA: SIMPL domain-containing protein [Terriglobales bacterium]|nr:SIMPL domain-containing protein [Terriglobales bacterium]